MGRFRDALARPGLGAIAEVKRRSPSAGDLRPDADPAALADASRRPAPPRSPSSWTSASRGTVDDLRAARARDGAPAPRQGLLLDRSTSGDGEANGADAALLLLRDLDDRQRAS